MGRLFWKFFFASWFALVVAAVGAAAAVSLQYRYVTEHRPHPAHATAPEEAAPPPMLGPRRLARPFPWPWLHVIAGTLASVVVSALLAWYMARPIRSLRTAFDSAASGNLETRVGPLMGTRRDEIADLGRDFDRMAEQLQRLMAAQRRLLHDVSHELRSPLARLQAAIGLLRQDPNQQERSLARIEREAVRLNELVGELLTLARLDSGAMSELAQPLDLSEIVAEIFYDAKFEAETAGRALDVAALEKANVIGRAEPLHRAIENVVRNAIQYAPEGTAVCVALTTDAERSRATLTVTDRGPGIAEEELANIFQPFFRATSAPDGKGFGLGLAIARRAIEIHHGTIDMQNVEGGGLKVTIELPLA